MKKIAVSSREAPAAIGPYAQAVVVGDMLYASGQIPLQPATGAIVNGDFEGQCIQVFKNVGAILRAAGADFDDVIKTTVFLSDMQNFNTFNEVYQSYFEEPYPARSVVQVAALPKNAQVEMEFIAYMGD